MSVSQYNDTLSFLADTIQISYDNPDSRPENISFSDTTLDYDRQKSTGLWSHYENDDMIIVSLHGVNDLILSITAVGQFLSPDTEFREVSNFCRKYDELIKEEKIVFLAGHSLGAFAIVQCSRRHSKKIKSFLFAPYVPRRFGQVHNDIRQESQFKKIIYSNDWLGSNMLKGGGVLRDTIILEPENIRFETHRIRNYTKSSDTVNKDFKQYFS